LSTYSFSLHPQVVKIRSLLDAADTSLKVYCIRLLSDYEAINVNVNHQFIQRVTTEASNALNMLVSGWGIIISDQT